jgi:hypothetical protein
MRERCDHDRWIREIQCDKLNPSLVALKIKEGRHEPSWEGLSIYSQQESEQ